MKPRIADDFDNISKEMERLTRQTDIFRNSIIEIIVPIVQSVKVKVVSIACPDHPEKTQQHENHFICFEPGCYWEGKLVNKEESGLWPS